MSSPATKVPEREPAARTEPPHQLSPKRTSMLVRSLASQSSVLPVAADAGDPKAAEAQNTSLIDSYLEAVGGGPREGRDRAAQSVALIADEVASAFAAIEEMTEVLHSRTAELDALKTKLAAETARADAAQETLRVTAAALATARARAPVATVGVVHSQRVPSLPGSGTLGDAKAILPSDVFDVECQRASKTRGKRFKVTAKFGAHDTLIFADVPSIASWMRGDESAPEPLDPAAKCEAKETTAREEAERANAAAIATASGVDAPSASLPRYAECLEITEEDCDGDVFVLYRANDHDTLKAISDDLRATYGITVSADDLKDANAHYKGLRKAAPLDRGTTIHVPDEFICADGGQHDSIDALAAFLALRAAQRVAEVRQRSADVAQAKQRIVEERRERRLTWGREQRAALARVAVARQAVREAELEKARARAAEVAAKRQKRAARAAEAAERERSLAALAAASSNGASLFAAGARAGSFGRLVVDEDDVFENGDDAAVFETGADDTLRTVSDVLSAVYGIRVSVEQLLAANLAQIPPSALSGWTKIEAGTRMAIPVEHVEASRFGTVGALKAWLRDQAAAVAATEAKQRAARVGRIVSGRWRMQGTEDGQPDFTYEMELLVVPPSPRGSSPGSSSGSSARDTVDVVGFWLDGAQKLRGTVNISEATMVVSLQQLAEDDVTIANTCIARVEQPQQHRCGRAARPRLVDGEWSDGADGNSGQFTVRSQTLFISFVSSCLSVSL